jgi:hypothetical protein
MKVIYLALVVLFAHEAAAQDFCKHIKKEISDDKTQTDYFSPTMNFVSVKRSISTNPDFTFDNFFLVFQLNTDIDNIYNKTAGGGQVEKKEKSLVIQFDDNSRIVNDTIQINHDFTEDRAEAIRTVYFPISETELKDLVAKKITKVTLAGQERIVATDTANAVLHYVQCIKAGK